MSGAGTDTVWNALTRYYILCLWWSKSTLDIRHWVKVKVKACCVLYNVLCTIPGTRHSTVLCELYGVRVRVVRSFFSFWCFCSFRVSDNVPWPCQLTWILNLRLRLRWFAPASAAAASVDFVNLATTVYIWMQAEMWHDATSIRS